MLMLHKNNRKTTIKQYDLARKQKRTTTFYGEEPSMKNDIYTATMTFVCSVVCNPYSMHSILTTLEDYITDAVQPAYNVVTP